ncbi:VOC family protein [Haloferula sp.]|uniref:VOC family protein n=1 Tax=Haloferula sp. TaxID=2497595 RepID=UPI00329DBA76
MDRKPQLKNVNWIDMIVRDPDKVSSFYTDVIGMTREPVKEDEEHTSYSLHDDTGEEVLGICDEGVFPDWVQGWLPYIDIDDFETRIAKVVESGGEIIKSMTMDYNWKGQRMCLVRDPSGAPIMLCESNPKP